MSQSPRISLHNAEGPETQRDHTIHITQTRMPQVQEQPVDLDAKMRKPVPTKIKTVENVGDETLTHDAWIHKKKKKKTKRNADE